MRLLLPIFALVAFIAYKRPDWLRGLNSAGRHIATGLADLGSSFGVGPGRGIGAAPAEAVEPGEPSAPSARGRAAEGRQDAVVEVSPDAATTCEVSPDLPRPATAATAGCEPMDGTCGVHEPRARFEEARGQPVRRPPSGGGIPELEALVSGNGEERRVGGAEDEAVFQSNQGTAESQRPPAQNAMQDFGGVGGGTAGVVLGTVGNASRPAAPPGAAEGGMRDLQRSMTGLVEGLARTNLRLAEEMFRMGDPAAVVELQQRFVREHMDALLQSSATVVRAMRRTADETLRPLEEKRFPDAAE